MRAVLLSLPADEPLGENIDMKEHGLNSMSIIELVVSLEEEYDIVFADELLTRENFATPGRVWRVTADLVSEITPSGQVG